MRSQFDFINKILIEELYNKQLPCLTSFREGLDHFGLIKLLQNNPDLWKPFFVEKDGSQSKPITAKYCTSNLHVPPLGLKTKIKVLYGNKDCTMPDSDTCFNLLKLPVIYTEYSKFEKVMLGSLRHGSC